MTMPLPPPAQAPSAARRRKPPTGQLPLVVPGQGEAVLGGRPARPLVAVELFPGPLVQAAWWTAPGLRATPLVIVGTGGRVLALCPLAGDAGVTPGQSLTQARLRCPEIMARPPDSAAAAVLWEMALATLTTVSPLVEAADPQPGRAYLDPSGLLGLWGDAQAVAGQSLRALAHRGIAARAGVGPGRVVALALARRMGTGTPQTLDEEGARAFVRALPIDDPALETPPATARALSELGVTTAGTLAGLPPTTLVARFGPGILPAWRCAVGAPDLPLRPWSPPERLTATYQDEDGLENRLHLEALLGLLGQQLATALAGKGKATALLTLCLVCAGGERQIRRQQSWPPLEGTAALTTTAGRLLGEMRLQAPVEKFTLTATDLCAPQWRQTDLWGEDHELRRRQTRLAATLAAHTRRYDRGHLRRLRRDPLAADGWAWEEWDAAP